MKQRDDRTVTAIKLDDGSILELPRPMTYYEAMMEKRRVQGEAQIAAAHAPNEDPS